MYVLIAVILLMEGVMLNYVQIVMNPGIVTSLILIVRKQIEINIIMSVSFVVY